tara:strand:- start:30723 stop:31550 length:828 start_codon:yes stop_codon:yes gene_type:complete
MIFQKDVKKNIQYLKDHKKELIAEKYTQIKQADAFQSVCGYYEKGEEVAKRNEVRNWKDLNSVKVEAVINTTNVIDSHSDLHVPGIWDKSLKQNANQMAHIQEHKSGQFDSIISDGEDLNVSVKNFTWKELGQPYSGKTQALVFDSVVHKDRNEFMFGQYAKGFVKNHSVGMGYDEFSLAVNDPDDKYWEKEYNTWKEYIGQAVNPEVAEDQGFFYVVTQAKAYEGSAVPMGSNHITPTNSVSAKTEETPVKDNTPSENKGNKKKLELIKMRKQK